MRKVAQESEGGHSLLFAERKPASRDQNFAFPVEMSLSKTKHKDVMSTKSQRSP